MKTQIKKRVLSLVSQYHTQDPVELAESLNILVLFEDLGQIGGYYNPAYRQKMIHINDRLSDPMRKFTAAHELGHALLHSHMNTPFLRTNTCFSVDAFERQANIFAAYLLISDEDLRENAHLTQEQYARLLGYPQQFIELRLSL